MPYATQQDILTYINGNDLTAFLDDDRDGTADAGLLDSIIENCSADVDGRLANIYPVPFADPAPRKVKAAVVTLICEALYARRLAPDELNPFRTRANNWREEMTKIGHGDLELDAKFKRDFPPGAVLQRPLIFNANSL